MWLRTSGSCNRSLTMMFGQTYTPMYKRLKLGSRVLRMLSLLKCPDANISLPTYAELQKYQKATGAEYPEVSEV